MFMLEEVHEAIYARNSLLKPVALVIALTQISVEFRYGAVASGLTYLFSRKWTSDKTVQSEGSASLDYWQQSGRFSLRKPYSLISKIVFVISTEIYQAIGCHFNNTSR